MEQRIEELLEKYYAGSTSVEEEELLENYFTGEANEELALHKAQFLYFQQKRSKQEEFRTMKVEELIETPGQPVTKGYTLTWGLGIAASVTLLLLGFLGGMVLQNERYHDANQQIVDLKEDMSSLREMFLIAQLKQPSPTERIQGISIASNLSEKNPQVISLLIKVLNEDANNNVRIYAANVLAEFASNEEIRNALISSLSQQHSLATQVAIVNGLLELGSQQAFDSVQSAIERGYLPKEYAEQLRKELESYKVKI